jgi:hypothetical protein
VWLGYFFSVHPGSGSFIGAEYGRILRIDPATKAVFKVPLGNRSRGIRSSPDDHTIYVIGEIAGSVTVADAVKREPIKEIQIAKNRGNSTGEGHRFLRFQKSVREYRKGAAIKYSC